MDLNKGFPLKQQQDIDLNKGFPLKQQQDIDLNKGFPLKQQQDVDLNKGFPLKQQQDMDLNKGFPLKQQQDVDLNKGFPLKQQQDMDLNKGFPLKQQQNYDIQWAPTTPAKVTSASSQRSQPSGSNWLEPTVMPCQLRGSSSPGLPNHLRGGHHTLSAAGHASMGSIIMLRAPSTSSGNANSSECWSPLMSGSANAICNADGTSKMLSCNPLLLQIDERWEMPSAQNMFMAKGKLVLAPNLSNNRCSCCGSQTYEYRLPVASIPNYDSLSAPPTPATTEKFNKRAQDKQPSSEVTKLVEEWGRGENQMAKEVSLYQPEMKRLRSDRDIPVLYEETSDRLIRVENSSTDRETKAIDLLGTPNKRPQRKKHRPKVFKEGKPSRTPKLATSPSDMDGSSCKRKYVRRNKDVIHSSEKENTSCRRKYARRSKDVAHSSNTNAFEEIIETESKGKAKSPRRCLNFDSEDPQAMEEFSAAMLVFKKVLGDRSRDVRDESAAKSSSSTKASDSSWVQDQVAVKPSTYQSQNECLQQIPVPYAEVNKNICALDEQIPSLKSSVKHFKALARESACYYSSPPKSSSEISQSNLNPLGISDSPPKGMKMCHLSTDEARESAQKRSTHSYNLDSPPKGMKMCHLSTNEARESAQKRITHPYNLRGCSSKSHDAARQNSNLAGVHKAIRMEKWGHSEANQKFSPSWEMKQLSNNSLEFKFADAQRFIAQEKAQILQRILAFHQTEKYAIKNAGLDGELASLSSIKSWGRKSIPTKQFKQKNKDIFQPSTPENKICGNQAHPQKSEDIDKSLQQAQSHLLYSMSSSTKHTCVEVRKAHSNDIYPAQKNANIGILATRNLNGKKLYTKTISADCQSTSYFNVPTYSSFSSGALAYVDPVDCIVEKLRHLYISSHHEVASSHPQNALVPYARHGFMMVPYDRSFELVKRRRPRAKVDLDPESNRVWKLLMGKDCGEGGEPPDVDKEKWWDEERRVFEGRVDSFIARMHLVQGDRRYSQWKGSVVDSVVGVFLTQNVSDHLSSSAFMSLAAKFPISSRGKFSVPETERVNTSMESQNRSLFDNGLFQSSVEVSASQNGEGKETSNCSEILGSTTRSSITYYSRQKGKGKGPDSRKKEVILCQESTASGSGINLGETEDIRLTDSQNSVVSCQNSNGFHPNLNFEAGDLSAGSMTNALGSSSFTELLQMAEITGLKEFCNNNGGMISESQNKESVLNLRNNPFSTSQLENSEDTFQSCNVDSSLHHAELGLSDMLLPEPSQSDDLFNSKEKIRSRLQTTSSEISSCNFFEFMSGKCGGSEGSVVESTLSHKVLSSFKTTMNDSTRTQTTQNITLTEMDDRANLLSANHKNTEADALDTSKNENLEVRVSLETEVMARFQQKDENSIFKEERTSDSVQPSDEPCRNQQAAVSNNQTECNFEMPDRVGPNLKAEICSFPKTSPETANSAINTRKAEKSTYDWESLRKEVCCSKPAEERSSMTMDSLDWEAVRTADVSKVAEAIRARGMNNVLAERIQEFLNRLVREHGSIDLEWLRDVSPDKVKDYLLSIRGLGLKSAECVRLLTLRQLAFPVDTNVGRICVRLGWVPLQPLPESLQLHLLELYPVLATIQKYLWPRLCKLDQRTLYELHYQMITFGKVFCTKSKPNCNSCPMRGECRHFASAFASARLALPAPEDKSLLSLISPIASDESPSVFLNLRPFPQIEESLYSQEPAFQNNGEPIIEEPASPEPECQESLESAIEDAFYEDPEEIPTIKLDLTEFTKNLRNYMEENMELQDGSLSKALVTLTPEAASIPMPKLKNVSRLRTEHQVYEIPDTHPLLEGLDPREPDDPSPYLLAIWTPGETSQSTEPPKADCNFQDVGQPCERSTCFGCNSMREAESHKIRGTLLIPCRTAMRGSFPLNGTYFQVNEVFADHHSSREPVYVLRDWIWNLPRRTVYFGTSIPTIFKGLTTEGIQQCFWRGFVCVRGFDRVTRAPKPLYARLHFPASKATKNRNVGEPKVEKNSSN